MQSQGQRPSENRKDHHKAESEELKACKSLCGSDLNFSLLDWSFLDFMEPRETVQARWLAVTGAAAGGCKERKSGSEKEA